ncbi:hypothetical protein Lalb_Chr17g0346271 [Lupinus albus]|uniref:Uncharacterized protein n=1 Tax=Lupinus albus TaxID=3870 RepID=A0A6A4P3W9_LUPAL|nr:hypothetical protein Lalb_Chr17g0346271 [Lupinus albus]
MRKCITFYSWFQASFLKLLSLVLSIHICHCFSLMPLLFILSPIGMSFDRVISLILLCS